MSNLSTTLFYIEKKKGYNLYPFAILLWPIHPIFIHHKLNKSSIESE